MVVKIKEKTKTMLHIDPVCKKKIRRKEEYAMIKYGGVVYHLCRKACKDEFEKHPLEIYSQNQISC